jgi:hypothetical protein
MSSQIVIQMEEDRVQLVERAEKLFHYMQSDTFRNLPYKHRDVIQRQYRIMRDYTHILQERIKIEKVY